MKIKVLGCYGGQLPGYNVSGFLLDNETLIDAGTIGAKIDIGLQRKIKRIFISHPHLDHIGAIPFYGVNIVSNKSKSVKIIGTDYTISTIQNNLMNGSIWPDFSKIKNAFGYNIFEYIKIETDKWYTIDGYKLIAKKVNHTIPTNGYIIGKNNSYFLYTGDTKQTDEIWNEAKKLGKRLKSVIVEVAFPDELKILAENSAHLVPETLKGELKKLGNLKPHVFIVHMKPEYLIQIKKQLKKIKGYKISLMQEGKTYTVA